VSKRVLIVAGEPSGDAQAAHLAKAMRAGDSSLELYGIGGGRMRDAGVDTFVDVHELSVMGISEVIGGVRRVWRCYRRLVRELRGASRPALVILVDFPDFNLRVARIAHRAGVKVLYYVSPQVWAWRTRRIDKICKRVDRMIVLFPFEVDLYRARGLDVHFVGYPLAEEVRPTRPIEQTRERYGLPLDRPLVSVLPGSRAKTVAHNLPVMLDALRLLGDRAAFAVSSAPGLDRERVASQVAAAGLDVAIVEGDTYNLLAASDVVAVTSGTSTVECALLERPMVVVYRMSPISYAIARRLVKVPYIAMPNLLLGERVIPELIQGSLSGESLAAELERYLDDDELCRSARVRLGAIREALVKPGAAERAAALAMEMIA
jgi:lipid-A-disaccharide synthase